MAAGQDKRKKWTSRTVEIKVWKILAALVVLPILVMLVVETAGIDAPALDSQGSLQSRYMRIVERFAPSDDQARLDYEMTMTDPVALSSPAVFRYEFLALEQEMSREVCSPPGQ